MKGKRKWLTAALAAAVAVATVFDLEPVASLLDGVLCVVDPAMCPAVL